MQFPGRNPRAGMKGNTLSLAEKVTVVGDKRREGASDTTAGAGTAPIAADTRDPLADALLYLAAHHGRALSRQALLTGLPIPDGKLQPAFLSARPNAPGLRSKWSSGSCRHPGAGVAGRACHARRHNPHFACRVDTDPAQAKVIDPSAPDPYRAGAGQGGVDYLGYAFLARPLAVTDARTVAAGDLPKKHWFWSVASGSGPNYSHVAIAAFLVNILALASPLFIMNVYDRVVPNGAIASLVALSIGLLIAIVFDFVLRTVRSRIIDMTGKKLDVVLAAKIFEHVLSVKMAQRPASVGVLANQLRDFDSVREFFTSGTVVSATDLLFAHPVCRRPVHDRRPPRLDPADHAAADDRVGVAAAAPARPRDEALAGRIGGASRRAG